MSDRVDPGQPEGRQMTGADVRAVLKPIEGLFMELFGLKERPSMGICFQNQETGRVHWLTNVSREDGITLFLETGSRMKTEDNPGQETEEE